MRYCAKMSVCTCLHWGCKGLKRCSWAKVLITAVLVRYTGHTAITTMAMRSSTITTSIPETQKMRKNYKSDGKSKLSCAKLFFFLYVNKLKEKTQTNNDPAANSCVSKAWCSSFLFIWPWWLFFFLLDPKSNVSVIQVYINPQLKIVLKQTHNLILFE